MKNISVALIAILLTMNMAYASKLTPEYLLGEWCLKSMVNSTGATKENKNWVFEGDGKFLMQKSKRSKKMRHYGGWDIKDNELQINPLYVGGYMVVEIVSQDKFIFKWNGEVHLVRGVCK